MGRKAFKTEVMERETESGVGGDGGQESLVGKKEDRKAS